MPANPSLTFAEAVAVIKADDEQLRAGLRKAESAVTDSMGRMQADLNKAGIAAGGLAGGLDATAASGATATAAVGSLSVALSLLPISGASSIAVLASLSLQLRALVLSAAAANASITSLGIAMKTAFLSFLVVLLPVIKILAAVLAILTPYIIAWRLAVAEQNKANEALEETEKRLADVNARLERQTALRKELDKLRGVDAELGNAEGVERSLILEKRKVERDIETAKLRQLRAMEEQVRLDQLQRSEIEKRLRAEQGITQALADQQKALTAQTVERVRQKEATIRQFGPQSAGQARFVIDEAKRAFQFQERGLFELRRQVLSELSRGAIAETLARRLIGPLPGEGGAAQARTGQSTFLRRVEPGSGGQAIGVTLDKKRNDLLAKTKTAIDLLTTAVKDSGGFG